MDWFTLAIISTALFSVTALLQRVLMRDKASDPYAHSIAFQLLVAVLLFIFATVTGGFDVSGIEKLIPNVVLMGIFYALANITLNTSFKLLDAAEVQIFLASSALWTTIGAVIFLSESLTMLRIVGIITIFLGASIITWHGGKFTLRKGLLYGFATSVLFGLAITNDGYILSNLDNVPSYITIGFFLPGMMLLVAKPKAVKSFSFYATKKRFIRLLAVAAAYAGGSVAFWLAFQSGGDISQISPISQSSVVLTVLFAHFFLGEKERLWQKILGSVLTFAGVLIVS